MRKVLSASVENKPGVLAHIAGLFSSRGFNIDSLTVGRTADPNLSHMTIVTEGDEMVLEQVRKQLGKVIDVIKVTDYSGKDTVHRDLALIKVSTPAEKRAEIIALVEVFRGKVVDISLNDVVIELVGPEAKIEAFVEVMRTFGIKEMVRTGVVALARGEKNSKA